MSKNDMPISYSTHKLKNLIGNFEEEEINSLLKSIRCSINPDMEDFIRNKAIFMEKKDLTRTYIVVDPESGKPLGYYSLGMKCLRVPADAPVSRRTRDRMNVDADTSVSQSYLLGQLCRDDSAPKGLGAQMMKDALKIFKRSNELVGCRLVRIDCDGELRGYYESNGFRFISKNEQKNLDQMVIII